MPTWRPRGHIQVKTIGLHWRSGRVLVAEVLDDAGRVKGMRPLGGTVEFGERWADALRREFREELGVDAAPVGPHRVIENHYVHEGARGHEILFACEVRFPRRAFDGRTRLTFIESDGTTVAASWVDPDTLDQPGGPALYPVGLKALLGELGQPA